MTNNNSKDINTTTTTLSETEALDILKAKFDIIEKIYFSPDNFFNVTAGEEIKDFDKTILKYGTENLLKEVQFGNGEIEARDKYGDVYIPENLYIVGTVNMDETTFPFSKKVLDRANTIEFNKVDLKYNFDIDLDEVEFKERIYSNEFLKSNYLKISQCKDNKDIAIKVIDELIKINDILEKYNQHFGFRVRDEIVFYMIYAVKNNIFDFDKAMDYCITQKILPKIHGSNSDILEILVKIFNILNDSKFNAENYLDENTLKEMAKISKESNYKLSSEKLLYMIRRFVRDGFTTFWQ